MFVFALFNLQGTFTGHRLAVSLLILTQENAFVKNFFAFLGKFFHKNFGPSKKGPKCWFLGLFCVVYQTVSAIISAVYDRKRTAVILIAEREEIMLQQIHLQNCLFPGHWFEVELLDPDDA